jgi:hypothetical protein
LTAGGLPFSENVRLRFCLLQMALLPGMIMALLSLI